METEGIGELSYFIIYCVFLFAGITFFVSAWMSENKRFKISRIILGTILVTFFVILLLTSKENS
jgi:VIT1/CCC1 family predicted Fe2+/Mn2+ transporter